MDVIQLAFQNSFKKIDVELLELHILKSMAHAKQIRQIMCSEYGLDTIFGKNAVAHNVDFVAKVIDNTGNQATECYEETLKVFEDEEETRPASAKPGNCSHY